MVSVTAESIHTVDMTPRIETMSMEERIEQELAIFCGKMPDENGLLHDEANLIAASLYPHQLIDRSHIELVVWAERSRLQSYGNLYGTLPQDEGYFLMPVPISERKRISLENSALVDDQYRFVPTYYHPTGVQADAAAISTTPPSEQRYDKNADGSVTKVTTTVRERIYTGYRRI